MGASCIDNDENIWDDTLLIKAYEQSIKLQQAEMAKRLARATNQKSSEKGESTNEDEDGDDERTSVEEFQVGDFVRATYDADGIDYEAEIMLIDENSDCRIKFIGYENEQVVSMADLLPSWGPEERSKQTSEAADAAAAEEEDEYIATNGVEPTVQHFNPFNTHQFGSLLQPPPPPPMPPMLNEMTEDSEHLSAMLMAWYMSGYYTGLYQGHKMSKQKAEQQPQRRAPSSPKKKK